MGPSLPVVGLQPSHYNFLSLLPADLSPFLCAPSTLISKHTHTAHRSETQVQLAATLDSPPSPFASLYLWSRKDACRCWLCRCHQSLLVSPSGSADWGPLCFQQVP